MKWPLLIVGSLVLIYIITAVGETFECTNERLHHELQFRAVSEVWAYCANLHIGFPFSFFR
jgi:hypothetical protein